MKPPPRPAIDEASRKIDKAKRKPVVIYMVSPEVIHAEASEFMAIVQRLTGPSSAAAAAAEEDASASARPSTSGRGEQQLPVRVKARALNRSGTTQKDKETSARSVAAAASANETLFFQDLSPPAYDAVRKDDPMPPPPSWMLRGEYMDRSPRHEQGFAQGPPPPSWMLRGEYMDRSPRHEQGFAQGPPPYLDIFGKH